MTDEFIGQVARACNKRAIFVTIEGKLGLAPREAREGDIICLLEGALEACLLREMDNGEWSMISGSCFHLDLERKHCMSNLTGELDHVFFESLMSEPLEEFCLR